MEIKGYKAFNQDKKNRYGVPFKEGTSYSIDGVIKFGNFGNGYHMCKNLCDVFRYVDNSLGVCVAKVTGSGDYVKYDDEYYGYYDMYAMQKIRIDKFLTREEIIDKMLKADEISVMKFLMFFHLTEEEKILFVRKWRDSQKMMEAILYYQYGIHDIYEKKMSARRNEIRKVLSYEQRQNNN